MTKDNRYTGDTPITIAGKEYTLTFDWSAVGELLTFSKGEDVMALINTFDPKITARVLEIGLRRHHPEMTEADILRLSPPLLPTMAALKIATNRAAYGTDEPPPQKKAAPQKKSPSRRATSPAKR